MVPKASVTVFCLICLTVQAGRILVVMPFPSISHQVVFRAITQELARRGHDLVVVTTDPAFPKGEAPKNLREIDVHDISYEKWRKLAFSDITSGRKSDYPGQIRNVQPLIAEIFEMQMMSEEVQSIIQNKTNHFDLIMVEALVKPAISLVHVFNAPMILVGSCGGFGNHPYELVGAPVLPLLLYPTIVHQHLLNLTLWGKIKELLHIYTMEGILNEQLDNDDRTVRRIFGPDTPSIQDLQNKVDMLFLNVHPIWEFNRPVPPNVVYMGGIHQVPSKELPNDLKSYLDSSKHGVIYISFGTNVDPALLPAEKLQILVKTFSDLPYDILWKWNHDELPGRSENIRISKWLPQPDLLKHPKIKLFITQGGLQSTDEAITAGVPLIGLPMLGDQWYNVDLYVHHKIGLRLDMEDLTEQKFRAAVDTVLNDNSYRENVVKLRSIMTDQPQKPLDRAIWWTEHVMRHGGASHLRARAANISWSEYLDLELWTFIAACVFVILITFSFTVYLLIRLLKSILSGNIKVKFQ